MGRLPRLFQSLVSHRGYIFEPRVCGVFRHNFPDAVGLIGEDALSSAFKSNPRGSLMQVSCYPYSNGKGIILGMLRILWFHFMGKV